MPGGLLAELVCVLGELWLVWFVKTRTWGVLLLSKNLLEFSAKFKCRENFAVLGGRKLVIGVTI